MFLLAFLFCGTNLSRYGDVIAEKTGLGRSISHAVTGFMAVIMTGIAIVGLTYRLEKKTFLRLGWDAIAIFLAYIVNIYLLYSLRGGG